MQIGDDPVLPQADPGTITMATQLDFDLVA